MLESVLADVLTRVLGQYLKGIDRDSVQFGAWSGLVELRGVALRPEALAVLFETLGMDLPVTVEAGFIGLLRLQVPWKAIGTTPVRIHMEDVTIMARPVRGDGSDASELAQRELRLKRAKLDTDDAVREASWGVAAEEESTTSWTDWLVSDELRAKIIDNVHISLSDILLRFEDPFSDPRRPYIASIACDSLKAVSANAQWMEAFVERSPNSSESITRKLLEVKGFRVDWAPITPRDVPGHSRGTRGSKDEDGHRFETPESLKEFVMSSGITDGEPLCANGAKGILKPVDGSMRLRLVTGSLGASAGDLSDGEVDPRVDLDVRFPDVIVDLDDVQYACLLQTSVYFARLATRGVRPTTARGRWVWAIDQLLPGFSTRRARALRLTEKGIQESRDRRLVYVAYRKSVLKARRTAVAEPNQIARDLEELENSVSYEEVIAMRDVVDRQIELEGEDWRPATAKANSDEEGTTTSSLWHMLGYGKEKSAKASARSASADGGEASVRNRNIVQTSKVETESSASVRGVLLRVAFVLRGASIRLSQNGFPKISVPRVALILSNFRAGVLYTDTGSLTIEAVLGSVEAHDISKGTKMVYSRANLTSEVHGEEVEEISGSPYPRDVSEAILSIRKGLNPAREVLGVEESDPEEEGEELPVDSDVDITGDAPSSSPLLSAAQDRIGARSRSRERSESRDSTPSTFRVSEAEFLGTVEDVSEEQKYVAAFRYSYVSSKSKESPQPGSSKLDVSVATLEAVVDGPKGSFIWGLKFWQPKGMAQDPIMAFLGAAAGARIAELRMEIQEALVAHKVPLQINAVILAPRFVIPSQNPNSPSLVINMGTLGICTSDNANPKGSGTKKIRYSNYVLTLDDLGVYLSPDLGSAVSRSHSMAQRKDAVEGFRIGHDDRDFDTVKIERIIRPFSLQFILQTLRDASVVQVAHAPNSIENKRVEEVDNVAKVRIRGNIPGLYFILTRFAFQHIVTEGQRWSEEVSESDGSGNVQNNTFSGEDAGWQPVHTREEEEANNYVSRAPLGNVQEGNQYYEQQPHTQEALAMASYDFRIILRRVSLDIRESVDAKLVTAVTSRICADVVKTGKRKLQAKFSVKSWSVTDGSRGSTAAFRRLIYAGMRAGPTGVSPPRSFTGSVDETESVRATAAKQNENDFVSITYIRDLIANEQTVQVHFLSLHMVCVRETYLKLAKFLDRVRRNAKKAKKGRRTEKSVPSQNDTVRTNLASPSKSAPRSLSMAADAFPDTVVLTKRTYITATFDGFSFQLVASGGGIAMVEMQNSNVQFLKSEHGEMKAWGEFQHISVRDWTAPVQEHISVLSYEKRTADTEHAGNGRNADRLPEDGWTLSIPSSTSDRFALTACFEGMHICFLYRFVEVVQKYFSALNERVSPVFNAVLEDCEGGNETGNDIELAGSSNSAFAAFVVNLEFTNFSIRLPRHSGCPSESLNVTMSSIQINNSKNHTVKNEWQTAFRGMEFAVDYVTSPHMSSSAREVVSAPFLTGFGADLVLRSGKTDTVLRGDAHSKDSAISVRVDIADCVLVELCEAQYTVLYFVLTENLAETVSGIDVFDDLGELETSRTSATQSLGVDECNSRDDEATILAIEERSSVGIAHVRPDKKEVFVLDVDIHMSSLKVEISRGWDVSQRNCKVLGVHFDHVKLDFTYRTPSHLLFELAGGLVEMTEFIQPSSDECYVFGVPLLVDEDKSLDGVSDCLRRENLIISYEREYQSKPSIVLFLSRVQLEIPLELCRDLTFMAIPGWPYLESSALAPEVAYLGRTLTYVLSDSQVALMAQKSQSDRRAIVLMGEFQTKIDWIGGTGAKHASLRSTDFEVSTVSDFPLPRKVSKSNEGNCFQASRFRKTKTPLVYPTSSYVEYVDPGVDEAGCRLEIFVDSVLCLINASDIPLLRAVLSRPTRLRATHLSKREWRMSSAQSKDGGIVAQRDSKQERLRKASENMSLSVGIPASRYLVTDEGDGRFVPVLETRLKDFKVNAHLGNMVQTQGEIDMQLFNTAKGWWEPALEPWQLAASISNGQSGTRSVVVKSEKRLNFNVTPTTATAAMTVARALNSAATSRKSLSRNGRNLQQLQLSDDMKDMPGPRRPSVAAFVIRNELGLSVGMSLKGLSRKTVIPHRDELEVGVQSEDLVSSSTKGDGSREEALKCFVTVPGYQPSELSASEIGKHEAVFVPSIGSSDKHLEARSATGLSSGSMYVLWEVKMANGVPVGTLRSLLRLHNNTATALQFTISRQAEQEHPSGVDGSYQFSLQPNEFFPVPVNQVEWEIRTRPDLPDLFDWSSAFPGKPLCLDKRRFNSKEIVRTAVNQSDARTNGVTVQCRTAREGASDFFMALQFVNFQSTKSIRASSKRWVELVLVAPIVIENKLPGVLSYRVTRRSVSQDAAPQLGVSERIVAAGVIPSQGLSHMHFSMKQLRETFISLAYANSSAVQTCSDSLSSDATRETTEPSSIFGPDICFETFRTKRVGAVVPTENSSEEAGKQSRRALRVTISPRDADLPRFEVFAGFWIRNRSDTSVEVCSRASYYGAGSEPFFLEANPPLEDPNRYICLEGPYLSLGTPRDSSSSRGDVLDHSEWWTTPCVLVDIEKPIAVHIGGRSLQVEVRPANGLESSTMVITIRNISWICNTTSSIFQWCETSALDSHGNCRTRMLRTLGRDEVQGVHWESKSSKEAVHIRIADESGQSDWIWSQAIPLDIGHSRELPAKMYRPKSHEQYIARVASKEISGTSQALVVYAEDRQNPPYRIVNLCQKRAIAFSQIGSQERPWLVRAEKTTRYAWDNPLATPRDRKLMVRILEPEDLSAAKGPLPGQPPGGAGFSHRHDKCELNIDVVGERVLVLSESYEPSVAISVSVDGATKIVTFCDEDENGTPIVRTSGEDDQMAPERHSESVPVVGWDDMEHAPPDSEVGQISETQAAGEWLPDYPAVEPKKEHPRQEGGIMSGVDMDAAVFLDSVGISVVSSEPLELIYMSFCDIHLNYEADAETERLALQVSKFQVDNQIERTPYPVLLWTCLPTGLDAHKLITGEGVGNLLALAVEIHRTVSNDDIVMVNSFQCAVRALSVCFDDDFISKSLLFLKETSLVGSKSTLESLRGIDAEKLQFEAILPSKAPGDHRGSSGSEAREKGISSSKRIYLHDFCIHPTSLRLTSSGSGAAIAKAAGINPSARGLVALVLNVENCDFEFPALAVKNVFDSLHHFMILIREYYLTQLKNQRMKLLASNALMGNPAALFDAVGTGAREFFTEPGRAKGSADFIASVGRGSKSLFSHTVGGLVGSVSSIPRAMSSGIERALGDDEYLAERERIYGSHLAGGHRGSASKNSAQGLATGALSFAHGISSGVTGFIREPVQGARRGGAGGLLKGIGKAFIGGVAKPVAGAIDLVAEPAAGLSRQITDVDSLRSGQNTVAPKPERPPRAFRGQNQRLDAFEMRVAVGDCIYKAVQIVSGARYTSELIGWVELSDRPERATEGSEMWIWDIVQRYCRAMPGTKREMRANPRRNESGSSDVRNRNDPGSRPEKTRVALITMTDVIVATLDCKLVMAVPLWEDCKYRILADGKETVITAKLRNTRSGNASAQGAGLSGGPPSLISAPWDVSAAVKRRKPDIGEEVVSHMPCGSLEARDELCAFLRRVTQRILASVEDAPESSAQLRDADSSGQGVELSSLSNVDSKDWLEMKPPEQRSVSRVVSPNTELLGPISKIGQSSVTGGRSRAGVLTRSLGLGPRQRANQSGAVDKKVRRLAAAPLRASASGLESVKVVVVNKLGSRQSLFLNAFSVENGIWTEDPPSVIESGDAAAFELERLSNITGSVSYNIGTDEGHARQGRWAILVEFFDAGETLVSFSTRAAAGFRIEVDSKNGSKWTTVLAVFENVDGAGHSGQEVQSSNSTKLPAGEGGGVDKGDNAPGGERVGSSGDGRGVGMKASDDEASLEQLLDIGFKMEDAVSALAEAEGDLVKAVDILTR